MHGKGEYTWKDGRKYVGDYYNDKKHVKSFLNYIENWKLKSYF